MHGVVTVDNLAPTVVEYQQQPMSPTDVVMTLGTACMALDRVANYCRHELEHPERLTPPMAAELRQDIHGLAFERDVLHAMMQRMAALYSGRISA